MSDILQERRASGAPASQSQLPMAERDTELLSPATQIVGDKDAYLGNAPSDIGRRIADDQLELFVVCQPAEAMLQQFAQLAPDFIAIHDVGTAISARLLAAVAAASSRKLQRLVIRRQGYGVALATLQFVELPISPGRNLRIYTTQIDGDTQTRHQLAHVLIAHSRLAVIMVGDLPGHALESSLQPLRDAIAQGPWPNRHILMVPMSSTATLPAQAASLVGHSGVLVRTTPQVSRPADAWSYISGAWNRLTKAPDATPTASQVMPQAAAASSPVASTAPPTPRVPAYAPTRQPELSPKASVATFASPLLSTTGGPSWSEYVKRCSTIKGMLECSIFDIDLQRSLAHSGSQRMADRLAAKGSMLHAMMVDSARVLGLAAAAPDATITLDEHHLLLRPMPGHPGVAIHMLLDRHRGDVNTARAQLQEFDQALVVQG